MNEGQTVSFSSAGSAKGADATGTTLTYAWDFGDSTGTSTLANPTYTYPDDSGTGSFTVTLTVTDDAGGKGTASITITVKNVAPAISSVTASPDPVNEGTPTTITINATDAAGDTAAGLGYLFDCDNNGTFEQIGMGATANSHRCTFLDDSPHKINVKVRDKDGGETTGDVTVTVNNAPPQVTAVPPTAPVNEGRSFTRQVANFTDAGTQDTHTFTIDWGAGTPADTGVATAGAVFGGHTYADNKAGGGYDVIVTVVDSGDATSQATFKIDVQKRASHDPPGCRQSADNQDFGAQHDYRGRLTTSRPTLPPSSTPSTVRETTTSPTFRMPPTCPPSPTSVTSRSPTRAPTPSKYRSRTKTRE